MQRFYYYPAIFTKEKVGYSVKFYDIDNIGTEGDTLEEAIAMAQDALGLYITDIIEDGKEIPKRTENIEIIKLNKNQILVLIELDYVEYNRRVDNKSVKKTLSIPSWLNTLAERESINFSQVLQEALKNKLNLAHS